MKTISIIGASGHVGYRLVDRLSKKYKIICIVRDLAKRDFSDFSNIQVMKLKDISDNIELARIIRNSDAIINTGYIWFAKDILKAIDLNEKQPEHIIFTGSTGVHTKLPSASADNKRKAELFIRDSYHLPWTIIRPTMIFGHKDDGNISKLISVFSKTPIMPLIGNAENSVQPVYIDDLVKAYDIAIFEDSFYRKAYDIAGQYALSNKELFQKVSYMLSNKTYFVSLPPSLIMMVIEVLKYFKYQPLSKEQVKRFQEDKAIDILEFVDAFHFKPRSFDEGLRLLIEDMNMSLLTKRSI